MEIEFQEREIQIKRKCYERASMAKGNKLQDGFNDFHFINPTTVTIATGDRRRLSWGAGEHEHLCRLHEVTGHVTLQGE